MDPVDVLRKPLLTEKTTEAMQDANVYAFEVDRRATKTDIKAAVEQAFGVTVEKVNTSLRKGKVRRLKYGWVQEKKTKHAMVRVKDGDVIELF